MKRIRRGVISGIVCSSSLVAFLLAGWRAMGKDPMAYEHERAEAMLDRVSEDIQKNFYDRNLHGLQWDSLKEDAHQKILNATMNGQMFTAIFALVDKLQDSHTVFIPPAHAARTLYGFDAKAFGDQILVYQIKKKGPAERAGLERGDRLLAVNGYAATRANFDKMMLFFRALIPVREMFLTVVRGNQAQQTIKMQAEIHEGTVLTDLTKLETIYRLIRDAEDEPAVAEYETYPDGIGYVLWREFSSDPEPLLESLGKVRKASALIVDLRGNPGGAVPTLTNVAGYFVTEPAVLADTQGRKKSEPLKVKPHHPTFTGPLYVLVDSQSSSAAEIFARYFQRTRRAFVIGDQTSGRVAEARIFPEQLGQEIAALYGVEIDVARVVFPGGEDLEDRGVTPDKLCLPTSDDLRQGLDVCRGTAVQMARLALKLPELSQSDLEQVEAEKDKK